MLQVKFKKSIQMSEEVKNEEGDSLSSIGHKRQNTENGGPASKKANITESGRVINNDN